MDNIKIIETKFRVINYQQLKKKKMESLLSLKNNILYNIIICVSLTR